MNVDIHKIWAANAADKILEALKKKALVTTIRDDRKARAEIVELLVEEAKNLPS